MVSQLINSRGNAVRNQFVITEGNTVAFQSYASRVCEIRPASMGFDRVVCFGCDYNYSNTTSKHLNKFLEDNGLSILATAKDRHEAIKRGHARLNESIAVIYDDTMR